MVKAGIYLVARLAPGYADLAVWHPIVIALGVLTMLVGGWRALRQYDLKLLLAYGTVSQLGFLVLVTGLRHARRGARGRRPAARARPVQGGAVPRGRHRRPRGRHARLAQALGTRAADARDRDVRDRRRRLDGRHAAAARLRRQGGRAHRVPRRGRRRATPWAWSPSSASVAGSVLTVAYTRPLRLGRVLRRRRTSQPTAAARTEGPRRSASRPASSRRRASSRAFAIAVHRAAARGLRRRAARAPRRTTSRSGTGSSPPCAISLARVRRSARCSCGAASAVARLQAAVAPVVDSARGYLGIVSVVDRLAAAVTTAIQHRGAARLPRDHRRGVRRRPRHGIRPEHRRGPTASGSGTTRRSRSSRSSWPSRRSPRPACASA